MYELHNIDCLKFMRGMADNSVNAVITDPPYNLGIDYGETTNDSRDDYVDWCSNWLKELERVCAGAIAISCGTTNLTMWSRIKDPLWILCWHKSFSVGHGA